MSSLLFWWCSLFNTTNKEKNIENTTSVAYQVLENITPILWLQTWNIEKTEFKRVDHDFNMLSIDGYALLKPDFQETEKITIFFETWRSGVENIADGTIAWKIGYDKENTVCVVHESMEWSEDQEIIDTPTTTLTISCGELPH